MRKELKIICTALFFIAIVNFFAFITVAARLGGDAVNGKVENGHYFVMSHGRYTEVSRRVWTYSRIHTISIFVTHPIGIAAVGLIGYLEKRRKTHRQLEVHGPGH